MQLTITTIIFGLPTGQYTTHLRLTLPSATLTARDLIACKIRKEFEECLSRHRTQLSGEYLAADELLDRTGQSNHVPPCEMAEEILRAQQAFAARSYMIVIDNRRVRMLDEEVALRTDARVEFIKILFAVGG